MMRPAALALLLVLFAGGVSADTPAVLWIERDAAKPWLVALQLAADRTQLPVGLLAELVGTESGFNPKAKSPHSSAFGCGQQTNGNPFLRIHGLNRASCRDSIMAAALQLRHELDRTHSLDLALRCYGTTHSMTLAKRRATIARMEAAARHVPL